MVLQFTLRKLGSLYSEGKISELDLHQILMELRLVTNKMIDHDSGWKLQNYLINWIPNNSKQQEINRWLTTQRRRALGLE